MVVAHQSLTDYYRYLLFQVLDAIAYRDNKDTYVEEFFTVVHQYALATLSDTLPHDRQTALRNSLRANEEDPGRIIAIISATFTEEQKRQALQIRAGH